MIPRHHRDHRRGDPGGLRDRRLQRPGPLAEPDRERLVADRRAAQAPLSTSSPTWSRPSRATPPTSARRSKRSSRPATRRCSAQARRTPRPQADNVLTGALRQLFALGEAYPDLKANQNFLAPAGGADRHRGPGRLRPAVLQRHACSTTTTSSSRSRPMFFAKHVQASSAREYFEADEAAREPRRPSSSDRRSPPIASAPRCSN